MRFKTLPSRFRLIESDLECIASVPKGEIIKDMAIVDDNLFVKTDEHIYRLTDDNRLEAAE